MLVSDRSGINRGVDEVEIASRLHRFGEVRIGHEVFYHVGIWVADVNLQEVGMLLGGDYARTRRIWLSDATRQMFVMTPCVAAASTQEAAPLAAPSR